MAVYQRSFRPYDGALTPAASRFLVPARYALRDLFRSKLFTVFVTLCFVFPLGCVFAIYLRHNADLLANLDFSVKSVNLQAKGKYYRIMFGPLPDRKAAADLCAKLKARDIYCDIAG